MRLRIEVACKLIVMRKVIFLIHRAIWMNFIVGNEEIVHLLLRNKANPKILNTKGKSAKDTASNKGNWKEDWHGK